MNILYGICGLGRGHVMRQLPVLEALLARGDRVAVFAYGESLAFLQRWAAHRPMLVQEVAVPFIVGTTTGIDLEASRIHPANQCDFEAVNAPAKAAVLAFLGTPDMVLTDYEPTAADVAYAQNVPLITVDQQSKFLLEDSMLPPVLGGLTPADEVARLRYFFPRAARRVACSFFAVGGTGDVCVVPPTFRHDIRALKRIPAPETTLTVYATTTNGGLDVAALVEVLAGFPHVRFDVFTQHTIEGLPSHVRFFTPDEQAFLAALGRSHGLIASAGHSLLSEAMYLGLPVLATPTAIYEQRLNALMIHEGGFGLCADGRVTHTDLELFLAGLEGYRNAISGDMRLLMRGDGTAQILAMIDHAKKEPA